MNFFLDFEIFLILIKVFISKVDIKFTSGIYNVLPDSYLLLKGQNLIFENDDEKESEDKMQTNWRMKRGTKSIISKGTK